jgi:hypothetical protein
MEWWWHPLARLIIRIFGKPEVRTTPSSSVATEPAVGTDIEWLRAQAELAKQQRLTLKELRASASAVKSVESPGPATIEPKDSSTCAAPRADQPPTLLDLYRRDFPNLMKLHGEQIAHQAGGQQYKFHATAYLDFPSQSWFGGFFMPSGPSSYAVCAYLADHHKQALDNFRASIYAQAKYPGDSSPTNTQDLVFSGRIFLYHEDDLSLRQAADLTDLFKTKGVALQLRGHDYAMSRWWRERSA